jgi:NADP-dependent aldehyde dehydrogenase
MTISGTQFINGERVAASYASFSSYDAVTGKALPYSFFLATEAEIDLAATAAAAAYPAFRTTGLDQRATFLETIADEIDDLDDQFIQLVMQETGLPETRVRGERVRTTNQLRLFAQVVRSGDFLGVRITTALPDRKPLPRPDIRQYRIGIGPVAVFGAGNFPLAFSVAGGDTVSALAAGCPVVVKAHSGHPGTSECVAQAVVRAVARCAMPAGVFGMLFGDNAGAPLVTHPAIKAVGFTGSPKGGRALFDLAAARPDPIPVFAEMSSINPVILMPGALAERSDAIAAGLADSVTLGSGQFCTNPGLVIGFQGAAFDAFCQKLADEIRNRPAAVMLNRPTLKNYLYGLNRHGQIAGIELLACGAAENGRAEACLFRADAALLSDPAHPLEDELFGPATVVVAVQDVAELLKLLPVMRGHLSTSLFANVDDLADACQLIDTFESRTGRLILNEFPTGVEVCEAMIHGGPWPATSDCRSTSVGTLAIDRFLRPLCYQGYPDSLLPPALQDNNPLGLRRLVNGTWC